MSTAAVKLVALLRDQRLRFFTTADFAALAELSGGAATQALRRMALPGLVIRIRRGLWCNRQAEGLELAEALPMITAPWPSYVSLYSALSRAGVLAEIPVTLYGVTSGPPRRMRTPLGDLSLHHLPARLLWGWIPPSLARSTGLMAEPEKALLDLAYLSVLPSSRLRFPTLRPGRSRLDRDKLKKYLRRFNHPPTGAFLKQRNIL